MTVLWKSYRMLRANPDLVPLMTRHERRIEKLPTWIIPKAEVRAMESKLQDGDIIGIISKDGPRLSTSHVGLAVRDGSGAVRFLHACSKKGVRAVILDAAPSAYLAGKPGSAGILVARPLK
jgi:hypothetical protein